MKNLLTKTTALFTLFILIVISLKAQKVAITTSPASARIYVDGALKATGSFVASVPKKDCIRVEVREDGYISEVRSYCRSKGNPPPDADFIQLKQDESLIPAIVTVTTQPQTAKIMVNGVVMGSGSLPVSVPSGECVTVEIKEDGFIPEIRDYCKKKGISMPPKSDYFKLIPDESYTSSVQSDIANNEILLNVKDGRSKEDAWKTIVSSILGKFDVLEMNDEKSGYLRTSWIGVTFKANTVRMRVIVKMSSENPLAFKIKFVSEMSGRAGTPFSADEQYQPFGRILKKYDGFLEELMTKLKN